MKVINTILQFLDPSLRASAFFLILLLVMNALAESLTVALIIPITLFLFDNNLVDTYPKLVSYIEFFSPFKYLAKAYSEKIIIISGLLIIFCLLFFITLEYRKLYLVVLQRFFYKNCLVYYAQHNSYRMGQCCPYDNLLA